MRRTLTELLLQAEQLSRREQASIKILLCKLINEIGEIDGRVGALESELARVRGELAAAKGRGDTTPTESVPADWVPDDESADYEESLGGAPLITEAATKFVEASEKGPSGVADEGLARASAALAAVVSAAGGDGAKVAAAVIGAAKEPAAEKKSESAPPSEPAAAGDPLASGKADNVAEEASPARVQEIIMSALEEPLRRAILARVNSIVKDVARIKR